MTGRSSRRRGIGSCPGPPPDSAVTARTMNHPAMPSGASEQLTQRFAEFGPAGTRLPGGPAGPSRYGKNQAERVLSLAAAYPAFGCPGGAGAGRAIRRVSALQAMQRILAARSQPKTPLDALADDHRTDLDRLLDGEPTPPRPTSDYQALLSEDPRDAETTDPPEDPDRPTVEGPAGQDAAPPACMTTSQGAANAGGRVGCRRRSTRRCQRRRRNR